MNTNAASSFRDDPYPSRVGREPRMVPRLDPVVYGPRDGQARPLARDELASFEDSGFLFFSGFFSADDVRAFRSELSRIVRDPRIRARPETITEAGCDDVRSVFRVHQLSRVFGEVASDPRVVAMVTQILGSDVYVHQSRINYKPGFSGKEFYWHSDFETWHVEDGLPRMRTLSCSINLTDNNEFNGPVMLIPGSHRHFVSCAGTTPE